MCRTWEEQQTAWNKIGKKAWKAKTGIPLKRQMSNKYENMLNKIESKGTADYNHNA